MSLYNVEIFSKEGEFLRWFPAKSMKEIFTTISRLENKQNLCGLSYSYLVFQKSNCGRYKFANYNYHKVCSINSSGKEIPYFLSLDK